MITPGEEKLPAHRVSTGNDSSFAHHRHTKGDLKISGYW